MPVQVWPGAFYERFAFVNLFLAKKSVLSFYGISMGFQSALEKSLTRFGENNSPTVVAMGVAMAKGIFRPTFTMMDKKEDYETKRYTAIREGLTELIAIPVYYLSGVASEYVAKKLANPKYFMSSDLFEKAQMPNPTEEAKNALNQAKKLAVENLPKLQTSVAFIGVCASALFIIPLLCSATIKPLMRQLDKSKKTDKPTVLDNNENPKNVTFKRLETYGRIHSYNPVMKVGGV